MSKSNPPLSLPNIDTEKYCSLCYECHVGCKFICELLNKPFRTSSRNYTFGPFANSLYFGENVADNLFSIALCLKSSSNLNQENL
jgi:hypothetical protein